MSFRPRSEKKPTTTGIQSPMPSLNNLTRVLEVGMANRAAGEVVMTEAQFFAEVDRLVEIDAPLLSLNKEELARYRAMAGEEARKYAQRAGDAAQRGAKEVARLTAKGAQQLVNQVKLAWEGSKKPFHFLTATPKVLANKLINDYKGDFTTNAWNNIKIAKDAARYYKVDSGANLHANIEFFDDRVKVRVFVSFQEDDPELNAIGDKLDWIRTKSFGDSVSVISYKAITALIDGMLKEGVKEIKAQLPK